MPGDRQQACLIQGDSRTVSQRQQKEPKSRALWPLLHPDANQHHSLSGGQGDAAYHCYRTHGPTRAWGYAHRAESHK